MKLLHKQLLIGCPPYLLLIIAVWIVHLGFLEPAERKRIRGATKRELHVQAQLIRQNIQRAISQLELISELPGMRSGDPVSVAAELKRIGPQHAELFAALHLHSLNPPIPTVQSLLVLAADEAQLNEGRVVVSDFRSTTAGLRPTVSLMVPVIVDGGPPAFALVGELNLVHVLPMLDPILNRDVIEYSLIDAQGKEISAANIRAATPSSRRTQLQPNGDWQNRIERVSADVTPWNWQVIKSIHWPLAIEALRLQRNLLSALCLLAMLLTAAGMVWLDRTTNVRLAKLIETIQVFGASDPTARAADARPDELGRLAETFNCMADDVAHAQRRLQKQLAEHQQSPRPAKDRAADLEARVDELERYAVRLAHEFKGPLVLLEGFASRLATAAKAGEWNQFDRDRFRMESICRQLAGVGDALLRLAKLDPARPPQAVSLLAAANEARERLALPTELADISDRLPTVMGDPVLWRQCFANLLQNAITACAETASPRIEIGCEERNGELVCFIRDNGRGMSAADWERVFDGVSVGLGLVRRIVEHHGGRVWAESGGPGTGTTIWWTVNKIQSLENARSATEE